MAHFAKVQNGLVMGVHVLANGVVDDLPFPESEPLGQAFLADLWGGDPAEYIQCSYNANFRGCYPGIGYSFDGDNFIPPAQPEPEPTPDDYTTQPEPVIEAP